MLKELRIKNFILIDDININIGNHLNVITGETGAGKSIIIDGIRICLGKKTSKDYLKDKDEKAVFELVFETENELYAISREIFPSGKAISRINGDVVNFQKLNELAESLVDIYSQSDSSILLNETNQMLLIDNFSDEIKTLKEQIKQIYDEYKNLQIKEEKLNKLSATDLDYLNFVIKELDDLDINIEEDEKIDKKFSVFNNSVHINTLVESLIESLESSKSSLYNSYKEIESLTEYQNEYNDYKERIDSLIIEVEDITNDFNSIDKIDVDDRELDYLTNRLNELNYVQKKYSKSLEELVKYNIELKNDIDEIREQKRNLENISIKKEELFNKYLDISKQIKEKRETVFKKLNTQMVSILEKVELKNIKMDISQILIDDKKIRLNAHYDLSILASMNNSDLKPLKDVASGGELSRIMLAIKSILGAKDEKKTLIFDEIDTGISGKTAFKVGLLIRELSKKNQIIAITHLAQLVCFNEKHIFIEKKDSNTILKVLNEKENIERLAIMMSSKLSDSSKQSAIELIKRAKE